MFSEVSELNAFYWTSVLCILLQGRGVTKVAHFEPEDSLFIIVLCRDTCAKLILVF